MRGVISAAVLAAVAIGGATSAQAQRPASVTRAAYTVEPFTPPGQVTISGSGVRLRAEPFATKETPVLSAGSTGLVLDVVGIARMADWNWYQVVLRNGQKAFVRSDLTSAPSRGGSAAPLTQAGYVAPQPFAPTPAAPIPVAPPIAVSPTPPAPISSPSTDAPISLVPRSEWTPQPRASDPNDLTSIDPDLTPH